MTHGVDGTVILTDPDEKGFVEVGNPETVENNSSSIWNPDNWNGRNHDQEVSINPNDWNENPNYHLNNPDNVVIGIWISVSKIGPTAKENGHSDLKEVSDKNRSKPVATRTGTADINRNTKIVENLQVERVHALVNSKIY